MPCFQPMPAWRTTSGGISIGRPNLQTRQTLADTDLLDLPCGSCIGCNMAQAKAWALRCHLELTQHLTAAFTTLTYDQSSLPPTLQKRHLQLWLKRLRKARGTHSRLRFFASGEYGEHNNRPHYHAILYGLAETDHQLVHDTWGYGFTETKPITPARISYCAGYTAKKIGWKDKRQTQHTDPTTGEVYTWQPPFLQMSRRPGLGGHARQWPESWRLYAIQNGTKQAVPRFLHNAWEQQATETEIENLLLEKREYLLNRDTTYARLHAAQQIAQAKQHIQADKRKL